MKIKLKKGNDTNGRGKRERDFSIQTKRQAPNKPPPLKKDHRVTDCRWFLKNTSSMLTKIIY